MVGDYQEDQRGSNHDSNILDLVSIEEWPKEVEDRTIPGYWEGDLIMGKGDHSLGTLDGTHYQNRYSSKGLKQTSGARC